MIQGNLPTRDVLVVDDEQLIRWSLNQSLTQAGYHVVEASDGAAARRHIQSSGDQLGLVLLDLRLPDCRDLTLLREIKSLKPDCPVIMMTAYGTPETTTEAVKCGAAFVTNKPFNTDDMVKLVATVLSDARPV